MAGPRPNDTGNALARRAQMFPQLTPEQIARIARVGTERTVEAGTLLFEQGVARTAFFVVLDGSIEIVSPTPHGEQTITIHEPGEFTGEVTLLTGRSSLVRGRMKTSGRLLEVSRADLRALVQTDVELSEIFMRAF